MAAPRGSIYVTKVDGIYPKGTPFRAPRGSKGPTAAYNAYQNARATRLGYSNHTDEKAAMRTPEYKRDIKEYRETLARGGKKYGPQQMKIFHNIFSRDYHQALKDKLPGMPLRIPQSDEMKKLLRRSPDILEMEEYLRLQTAIVGTPSDMSSDDYEELEELPWR